MPHSTSNDFSMSEPIEDESDAGDDVEAESAAVAVFAVG